MFTKRTSAPSRSNAYYNTPMNPCILGNYPKNSIKKTGLPGMNVLPNCVGYATGRFNEIAGLPNCKYLGNTDAKNYISLAKAQGLKIGSEPKLGSCIAWASEENGHVAIVEEVLSDTSILISQSGWSSSLPMWNGVHYKGPDGNWIEGYDYRWMKGKYKFLGFIYQPKEIIEMTQEEFNKMADAYIASRANLIADNYAKEALEWIKKEGIMSGNQSGNMMPKSFLTRQDFALMLKRALNGK